MKDEISFNGTRNDQVANSHFIVIHLTKFKTKIVALYRFPSTKLEQFTEKLEGMLDKKDNLICFGDANYDLYKPNDTNVRSYVQTLNNNNFTILNGLDSKDCTYREDKNGHAQAHTSILDHIFSDKFSNKEKKLKLTR